MEGSASRRFLGRSCATIGAWTRKREMVLPYFDYSSSSPGRASGRAGCLTHCPTLTLAPLLTGRAEHIEVCADASHEAGCHLLPDGHFRHRLGPNLFYSSLVLPTWKLLTRRPCTTARAVVVTVRRIDLTHFS